LNSVLLPTLGSPTIPAFIAGGVLLDVAASDPLFMVWTMDASGTVRFATPLAAELLLRGPVDRVVGSSISSLLPSEMAGWLVAAGERARESRDPVVTAGIWGGRRVRSTHVRHESPDGREEVLTVTRPAPLLNQPGSCRNVTCCPVADLGPLSVLTKREFEVLSMLGRGSTLAEIAAELDRAVKTIKRFRDGIAQKLGVGDRTRLGMIARDLGLEPEHALLPRVDDTVGRIPTLAQLVPTLVGRRPLEPRTDSETGSAGGSAGQHRAELSLQ
jgi:DNA-binding CsgD family transcriptional regulator